MLTIRNCKCEIETWWNPLRISMNIRNLSQNTKLIDKNAKFNQTSPACLPTAVHRSLSKAIEENKARYCLLTSPAFDSHLHPQYSVWRELSYQPLEATSNSLEVECFHGLRLSVEDAFTKRQPQMTTEEPIPGRPVLPFCPFWLHTFICLNSPELHCWLSSHPHCIKMLGLCFRVYVRRSQGAGTDPAKDSMPRACRRGQGLPSDLPKDSLCLHLVVIDCKFVVRKVFGMTLLKTACPRHAIVS